ncbi:hypothetical protein [Amycolatopsis dendrobii]|uniref:Uncharacterized protein n=1 Tax=Amycolatopsis dendrobii TaxID=2760662 RepID=A0A7W3VVS2_9PSEU|nr:hypothetical protein [Amycolatopsis dendrobii]MBB1153542.1 hypothetical protein [Amycolatopsis dendrobii]
MRDYSALEAFPELRRLAELDNAGWSFLPRTRTGGVPVVKGFYRWCENTRDLIIVSGIGDVVGMRNDPGDWRVWEYTGGLAEVVDALQSLPHPLLPHAPRLAIGHGQTLWVPPGAGGGR